MELNPITDIRCNSQLDSGIVSSETVHFVGEADNGNLENSPTTTMSHTKNSKEGKTPSKRPNKVVLLTFVDDGYDVAMEVAEIFRSSTPKIGVLILERNKEYLETSITGIHRWFNEVQKSLSRKKLFSHLKFYIFIYFYYISGGLHHSYNHRAVFVANSPKGRVHDDSRVIQFGYKICSLDLRYDE